MEIQIGHCCEEHAHHRLGSHEGEFLTVAVTLAGEEGAPRKAMSLRIAWGQVELALAGVPLRKEPVRFVILVDVPVNSHEVEGKLGSFGDALTVVKLYIADGLVDGRQRNRRVES